MKKFILPVLSVLFLTSCAAEKDIQLNETYWQQKNHKMAVTTVKPVKPGITMAGSQGLLDYAINNAMMNKLDLELNKTDLHWYHAMPIDIAAQFNKRHIGTIIENNDISDDDKLIASLAAEHQVQEVLVLRLIAVGAIRNYNGFVPISAPQGYCVVKGELIDPDTKKVMWRHLAAVKIPVQGEWDQPPTYPNVTAAAKQAIAMSRQEIFDSLLSGH